MSQLFQFPMLRAETRTMKMFRTPVPLWKSEKVSKVAERFAARGKVKETGSRFVIRDRKGVLEVFQASDSVWWTRHERRKEEIRRPFKLPPEDEAVEMARKYLRDRGLWEPNAQATAVTYTEISRLHKGEREPRVLRTAQHVNFGFEIDGFPVNGPGAKMQVTFGARGKVTECLKFWRNVVKERAFQPLAVDQAVDLLRQDTAFAHLRAGRDRVVFRRAGLCYYALPPREAQTYLIPAYAFEGAATTPELERNDFVRYVTAIQLSPQEAKRSGLMLQRLPAVA